VRVLELATVVLGPLACQLLGDQGADVVKVEPPGGDSNRQVGPMRTPDMGALFLNCNRNKRGVVLDLKNPQGREAALRWPPARTCWCTTTGAAALARLRLAYDDVRAVNPGASSTAEPTATDAPAPTADRPAYDDSIQAAAGIASLTAHGGGASRASCRPSWRTRRTALAVVAARERRLFHRARTGEGQEIEVPMFETLVSFVHDRAPVGRTFEPPLGPAGYVRLLSRERRPLPTTRRAPLGAALPRRALARVLSRGPARARPAGRPALREPGVARLSNIDALYVTLAVEVAKRSTGDWLETLERAGVPATPVRTLEELLDRPAPARDRLLADARAPDRRHPPRAVARLPLLADACGRASPGRRASASTPGRLLARGRLRGRGGRRALRGGRRALSFLTPGRSGRTCYPLATRMRQRRLCGMSGRIRVGVLMGGASERSATSRSRPAR
jgi:crotonobetainyl-CoA:carnitine CoA-transferase CaiB-like acyl-CoA transferase